MKVILKRCIIIRILRQASQQKASSLAYHHIKAPKPRLKLVHSLCARFTEDEHESDTGIRR